MARLSRTLLIVAVALAAFLATTASAQDLGALFGGSSSDATPVSTVQCKVRNCAMCIPGQSIACYKCNDGYRVIEKTFLCGLTCRVANCAECTTNLDVCQSCNPGYWVTKKGQCSNSRVSAAPAPAALWITAAVAVTSVANVMVL